MSEGYKDHDAVCMDPVGRIAKLGGFKVEFPAYITCYVDKGECYYFITSEKNMSTILLMKN